MILRSQEDRGKSGKMVKFLLQEGKKGKEGAGKKEGLQKNVRSNRPQRDFPGGSDNKESACNVGDPCSNPDNPLQYSYLENPMNRRAWKATVPEVTKSRT